jgi:phage terminase Nu1 subunit (DNA packaging protein)
MEDPDVRIARIRALIREMLVTDIELATAANVSPKTVRRWVRLGMPTVKVGRNRMFNPRVATFWLSERA